jgi:hypothetical protein
MKASLGNDDNEIDSRSTRFCWSNNYYLQIYWLGLHFVGGKPVGKSARKETLGRKTWFDLCDKPASLSVRDTYDPEHSKVLTFLTRRSGCP